MLKIIWNIIKKVFGVIFIIFSPLKRLICRRKRSNSDTLLPMTNHYSIPQDFTQSPSQAPELQSWDSWGNEDKSGTYSNGAYYNRSSSMQRQQQQQQEEEEEDLDYFQDMTPVIKKQRKVLVKKKDEDSTNFSNKFAVSNDLSLNASPDLGEWDDDAQSGWDQEATEDLSWQAEAALKEKKRLDRRQRNMEKQRQRNNDKSGSGSLSAIKLS